MLLESTLTTFTLWLIDDKVIPVKLDASINNTPSSFNEK